MDEVLGSIGLVALHVARMLVGEDHRFSIAATMVVGAVFASIPTKAILPWRSAEGLPSAREVIGCEKIDEVLSKLIIAVVV